MTAVKDANPPRRRAKQKQLEDNDGPIGPTTPVEVQDAAENYAETLKAKNKASAKLTSVKEDLLEAMKEHGVSTVVIQTDKGEKVIERVEDEKLKMRKPKDGFSPAETSDEDGDDE